MKVYELRLGGFTTVGSARERQTSIEHLLNHFAQDKIPSSCTVVGAERDFTLVVALYTNRRAAGLIAERIRAESSHPIELVDSDLDRHPDLREQHRSTQLQVINRVFGDTTGPVVQAGVIHGDVTLQTHEDPARHDVPIIVSVKHYSGDTLLVDADTPTPMPSYHSIHVLVEGRSAQAVILHALRPVVLARRAPRPGYLEPEPEPDSVIFCSRVETRFFDVILGAQSRLVPDGWGADFPFKVTSSDPDLPARLLETRVIGDRLAAGAGLDLRRPQWHRDDRRGRPPVPDLSVRPAALRPAAPAHPRPHVRESAVRRGQAVFAPPLRPSGPART